MKNSFTNTSGTQANKKKKRKISIALLTLVAVFVSTGYGALSAFAMEETDASSSSVAESSVSSEVSSQEIVSPDSSVSASSSSDESSVAAGSSAQGSEDGIPAELGTEELGQMNVMAAMAPAAATSREVVIDFSQPWDYSGQNGYLILGSGEFRLNNADYHYILKNMPSSEVYIFVGSGANYNDAVGRYTVTLENATINPWQWNMASFNVATSSTVDLYLVGNNTITAGNNWVNTRPLISVPSSSCLNIYGPGSLNVTSSVNSRTGAAIGTDNSGAFGNVTIYGGTVNVDVANTKAVGIGGTSTGMLLITGDSVVNVKGAANKPAIGIGSGGNITIAGNAVVNATGNTSGVGIGGAAGVITLEQNSRTTATGGANAAGIGFTGNGTIIIGGNSQVTAVGGQNGAGLASSISGRIDIVDSATVTAVGGENGFGIGGYNGVDGSNIHIDNGVNLRAYANHNYAIKADYTRGTAYIVNAYYTENATEGTFAPLSTAQNTTILNVEPNVVLPAGYTSFAYTAQDAGYYNEVLSGGKEYSLIQLDNTASVDAYTKLQAIALKLGVVYEINYYQNAVAPENLLGTIDSYGETAKGQSLDTSVKTSPKEVDSILNSSMVENDLQSSDWLNLFQPAVGYEAGVVSNSNFGSDILSANHYTVNVVYTTLSYGVTYQADDKTGGTVPSDAAKYKEGESVSVKAGAPTRTGFTFAGWKASFDGKTYAAGDTISMPAGAVVFTAQWNAIVSSSSSVSSSIPASSVAPVSSVASSSSSSQPTSTVSSSVASNSTASRAASTSVAASASQANSLAASSSALLTQQAAANDERQTVINRLAEEVPTIQFGDVQIPLFSRGEAFTWSLISLLLAIGSAVYAAFTLITFLAKRSQWAVTRRSVVKIAIAVAGVLSLVMFFLLYNLNGAMVVIDIKTLVFILFAGIQVALAVAARKIGAKTNQEAV